VSEPALTLRLWRPGDELAFTPRPDMAADVAATAWSWPRYGAPGPTWTLVRAADGAIVGIGGGVEKARGDWQLWSVLGEIGRREWPAALDCAREVIRTLQKEFRGNHFTALAHQDFPAAWRVLVRLGFNYYGTSMFWKDCAIFERFARRRKAA
jgi:RimJ/RimL family protein N-acetyltransferase